MRTILLHSEQGLGDTLQFIRYAPRVKALGGNVRVVCSQTLAALVAGVDGVDSILSPDDPAPAFDVHAPLMSLPYIFRTTLETIPADVPYLTANVADVASWRNELDDVPGLKVGISWAGNSRHPADRWRSIPLAEFARLANVPGVTFYSLQKGPESDSLLANSDLPIEDWGPRLTDMSATAAAVVRLDLVIACDTALVHLAGRGEARLGRTPDGADCAGCSSGATAPGIRRPGCFASVPGGNGPPCSTKSPRRWNARRPALQQAASTMCARCGLA